MIPQKIHYCWFGRGQMPKLALDCLASWKKYLPEYELILWNEDTFDVNISTFTKEAYEAKKYAFITDYVRLWALKNHGGIYMDTDVEVLKPLDDFLNLPAFSGFEDDNNIPTGIMASEKNGIWATEQLEYYKDKHFILPNGEFNNLTNVKIIGGLMAKDGFILKNSYQNHMDKIHMFPSDYFCPKSHHTKKITITDNTHVIHHFAGSWLSPWQKFRAICKEILQKLGLLDIILIFIKKKK